MYLLKNDKKVSKKRTSIKRGEQNPVFNEAILFSVPPYLLNSIQVRLTVMNSHSSVHDSSTSLNGNARKSSPIGHVIVGSRTDGKGLLHWHLMLTTLRKQVAFFHPLRRSVNKHSEMRKSTLCWTFLSSFTSPYQRSSTKGENAWKDSDARSHHFSAPPSSSSSYFSYPHNRLARVFRINKMITCCTNGSYAIITFNLFYTFFNNTS